MTWKVLKGLGMAYGLLLSAAVGGLAFANLAGVLAMILVFGGERAPDASVVRSAMNWGWTIGVGVALAGAVLSYRRRRRVNPPSNDKHAQKTERDQVDRVDSQDAARGTRHGLLASVGWGGVFGALIGAMFGGTLVLLWFSLTYSPFAPQSWVGSVSVERQRTTSARQESVLTTDHPVVFYAFGVPIVLGATAGAVLGGVYGVTDVK